MTTAGFVIPTATKEARLAVEESTLRCVDLPVTVLTQQWLRYGHIRLIC